MREGVLLLADRINVTRSSMPDFEEYIREIRDLWDTRHLTNMGAKHNKLQEKVAEYLKVQNVSLFTNGHLALEAVLSALGITGEVITTPFTFASTTDAIVKVGATPVFCDINYDDYTIDTKKIEALITDKTTAIVPVHVYGNLCDVDEIEEIAKKHGLKVVYDAAHAFGITKGGKGVAEFGDASMFSFHATKVFNTIEGGCVAYSDDELTEKLQCEKNFGMGFSGDPQIFAGNAKMNEFQAAMGLCNLRHIDAEIEKRKKIVTRYQENLKGIDGIKIWELQTGVCGNYAYFPIVIDAKVFHKNRDEVAEALATQGIFARKYFYPLTSDFECTRARFGESDTPIARYVSKNVLTLPLYADLSLDDVDRICEIIKK